MSVKRFSILSVILLLIISTVSSALAGPPSGEWVSGIFCQNTGTSATTLITIAFYAEGSSTATYTYDDTTPLDAGRSREYYTPDFGSLTSPFVGSAVVSADKQLVCKINTQTTGTGTSADYYRIATSNGLEESEAGTTVFVPQIAKNYSGWNSYMSVQNTSSSSVDVTVTYKDRYGTAFPSATENVEIAANSNKIFYQNDNTNLPDQWMGSAIISADNGTTNLAVIINMYNDGSDSNHAQLLSYNGSKSGADKLYITRVLRNYYAYNSGITVQNIGTEDTTIKITFYFPEASYVYNSGTISAGASLVLYLPDVTELDPVDSMHNNNRYASAVVEVITGGPIVANVNVDNRGGTGVPVERVGQGNTYSAFPEGAATTTIYFPQVPDKAYSNTFSGGFQIANQTATATTCDIVYNGDTDANETGVALAANGSIKRFAPDVPNLNDGYNDSVTVTCGQPVTGIMNFAVVVGSGLLGDSYTEGNGINK